MRIALVVVVATALATHAAQAHQTSIKYIELTIDGDRADVAFKVAASDVTEPMSLSPDAKPSPAAAAAAPATPAYVARWLAIAIPTNAGALACPQTTPHAAADSDGFVIVSWSVTCPRELDFIALDLGAFFAVDKRMEAIVRIGRAGGSDAITNVVRVGDSPITLRTGELSLARWVRDGIGHIYGHISFVLALLLVVMLRRGAGGWELKSFRQALRATATVITVFTIAHSMTLIAASLGWLALPPRLVESLIAASIAYTAAENIVRPDVRWRYALTFGFGLAHGLGFASALAVDLPAAGVVPVLCFNIGVEIGQLAIVAVALPVIYGCARVLGANRYRWAMPALSSVIFIFGTIWFVQRALGM